MRVPKREFGKIDYDVAQIFPSRGRDMQMHEIDQMAARGLVTFRYECVFSILAACLLSSPPTLRRRKLDRQASLLSADALFAGVWNSAETAVALNTSHQDEAPLP